MAPSAVKDLVKSHLTLAERVGDSVLCGKAASTAVALFPDDEEVKYSTYTDVDTLYAAGFRGPASPDAFNGHLTMLENLYTGSAQNDGLFNNWNAWNADLPCLKKSWYSDSAVGPGCSPFANGPLASFSGQLPALESQYCLFQGATNLDNWENDLPSLVNGMSMFFGCTSLAHFKGALPSLLSGYNMFSGCTQLSDASILYIAQNINDISGIEYDSSWDTDYGIFIDEFGIITFGKAVPAEAEVIFGQKGWTVVNTASA